MVTKLSINASLGRICSVIAKIHMVTKPQTSTLLFHIRSVLAKIHMVTKPQKYGSTFLNVIEY